MIAHSQTLPDTTEPAISPTTPLRLALGLVYVHFGLLKLFPDLSTAELLAGQTLGRLHLGLSPETGLLGLAVLECTIGVLFLCRLVPRVALALFALHMLGTLLPLVLLPELMFVRVPFAPTFEGQYILKNLVFLGAGWALYAEETRR